MNLRGVLRAAEPDEAERLVTFYTQANDPNVLPRPKSDFEKAANSGLFYVVEDTAGALRAATGVFDLVPGLESHKEAGGTLVVDPFRGKKLQQLLLQVRIAALVAFYPDAELISAVKPTNLRSLRNVQAVGFETWDSPIDEVFEPCVACDQREAATKESRRCCCDFNLLTKSKRVEAVRELLKTGATWCGTRGDERLEVELRGLLFKADGYRGALEDFVNAAGI